MFQPARGTRDFLPKEMRRRNWVLDNIRAVFEVYGYEPLGTPAFESWNMLKIKSGEDAINQIYFFKDKSDRELGLRFEWTASLARVVSLHRELPMPFKRFAIGPVWRYERPSEKSRREFWQTDVDIVGVSDPIADAEILAVAVDCLRRLGFKDFLIRLNDRRLLEAFVQISGMPEDRSLDVFRAVDKLDKIGVEGVLEELGKLGASSEASEKLLKSISKRGEPAKVLDAAREAFSDSPLGFDACSTLSKIVEYSEDFGVQPYIEIDTSLARGLDYYTGPVFEIYAKGFEEYGSIAGGGRYDELVQVLGGEPTPMTGISLGIERIVPLVETMGVFKDMNLGPQVLVAYVQKNLIGNAIEIAQKLRRAGIATDLDLLERGLRKQLDIANKRRIRKIVIVGERELSEGCITLRDMNTSEQRRVEIGKLSTEI
jgi:histidyl-tRNA synthetase